MPRHLFLSAETLGSDDFWLMFEAFGASRLLSEPFRVQFRAVSYIFHGFAAFIFFHFFDGRDRFRLHFIGSVPALMVL